MFRAVTDVPLEVTAAFHAFVMAWLPPHVHVTFQVLVATEPVLLTVTVAVKPLPHWLSTCIEAEQATVPLGGGEAVRVGLAVGVGDGEVVLVPLADGDGEAVLVPLAEGVGEPVRTLEEVGVGVLVPVLITGLALATSWSNCAGNHWPESGAFGRAPVSAPFQPAPGGA